MLKSKLIWEEKYSVGVKLIDNQHKQMFDTINELIDLLYSVPTADQVSKIINDLVAYKKHHFKTEEDLFDKYHYEFKEEHIAKHREFTQKLDILVSQNKGETVLLAFGLIDFLEDWLINHLMTCLLYTSDAADE